MIEDYDKYKIEFEEWIRQTFYNKDDCLDEVFFES